MTTLSIVIPAYNEERFIGTLLEQIQAVDLAPLGVDEGDHRRRRLLARSDQRDRRRRCRRAAAPAAGRTAGKGERRPRRASRWRPAIC